MYCKYCGGKSDPDAAFCSHCGRALKDPSGTQAAKAPAKKDSGDVQPVKVIVEQPDTSEQSKPNKANGFDIASFVVALLSLIWETMIWIVAVFIGPFNLIGPAVSDFLSGLSVGKAREESGEKKRGIMRWSEITRNGLATAAFVINCIALLLAVIYTIIFIVALLGE